MKKEFLFVLMAFSSAFVFGSNLQLSFTTEQVPGERAPNHVLAVWVEDNTGNYVASIAVYARERRGYLDAWNASSRGAIGDAISGATISEHKAHTVTWNGRDFRGNEVAKGAYVIKIEMTSEGVRPIASLAFDLTDAAYEKDYADETYYKQIKIIHSVTTSAFDDVQSSISVFNANVDRQNGTINVRFSARLSEHVSIKLYNLKGVLVKELYAENILAGQQQKVIDLPDDIKSGIYVIELKTPSQRVSQKLIR